MVSWFQIGSKVLNLRGVRILVRHSLVNAARANKPAWDCSGSATMPAPERSGPAPEGAFPNSKVPPAPGRWQLGGPGPPWHLPVPSARVGLGAARLADARLEL